MFFPPGNRRNKRSADIKNRIKENFISFSFQGDDGDVNVALIIFNNTTTYLILLKRVLKHYLS